MRAWFVVLLVLSLMGGCVDPHDEVDAGSAPLDALCAVAHRSWSAEPANPCDAMAEGSLLCYDEGELVLGLSAEDVGGLLDVRTCASGTVSVPDYGIGETAVEDLAAATGSPTCWGMTLAVDVDGHVTPDSCWWTSLDDRACGDEQVVGYFGAAYDTFVLTLPNDTGAALGAPQVIFDGAGDVTGCYEEEADEPVVE